MHTLQEKTVIKNEHITIKHDNELKLFLANWNHQNNLSMDTFKSQMKVFKSTFKKYIPHFTVWLQEGFTTEITPEAHLWVEENVNKECKDLGLKKVAFVVGKDVMAHLSVFSFFEEAKSCIQPKHFAGTQEAINWIFEKENFKDIDTDEIQIEYLGKTENGKSQFTIETSTQNTEATLKSFKHLIQENTFLKENAAKFYSLTQREKEVFSLYANGQGFKDIAEELFLSEFTVRTHWRNTKKKLAIRSLADISNYKNSFLH